METVDEGYIIKENNYYIKDLSYLMEDNKISDIDSINLTLSLSSAKYFSLKTADEIKDYLNSTGFNIKIYKVTKNIDYVEV